MILKAYELLSRLNHLTLTEENGKLSWIGTPQEWSRAELEIFEYENK